MLLFALNKFLRRIMSLILQNEKAKVYYMLFSELIEKISLYQSFLSVDEIIRAKKFHFDIDRNNFILARGYLRELVSLHLNCQPATLQFQYGPQGKPIIKGVSFNLSHTKIAFAVVIADKGNIGIDIENITREVDVDNLAQQVLSTDEINYLNNVPEKERKTVFYRCWSRKEAYVKALGVGISVGNLRNLTITTNNQPTAMFSDYQIFDLPMQDQHVIALALGANKP